MAAKDDKAEPTLEDLARQIDALRADLSTIMETLKALGLAQGRSAAEGMKARAEDARSAGEAELEALRARVDAMVVEADRMARQKPVAAMGIAAGFGFLVGLLLGRR